MFGEKTTEAFQFYHIGFLLLLYPLLFSTGISVFSIAHTHARTRAHALAHRALFPPCHHYLSFPSLVQ